MPTLGVLALLVLAVLLLVLAVGTNPRPPRLVRLAGSTTLGCYVVHMYFTLPLSFASPLAASLPARLGDGVGVLLQVAWVLGVPMAFQLTVGVLGHELLMLEMRVLMRALAIAWRVLRRLSARLASRLASLPKHRWRLAARKSSQKAKAAVEVFAPQIVSATLDGRGEELERGPAQALGLPCREGAPESPTYTI